MKPVTMQIRSSRGIEAYVTCDGSRDPEYDYYSTVQIKGAPDRRVYGVDPLQALTLGLTWTEQETRNQRLLAGADGTTIDGAAWWIESASG